ncbi:MAG: preprotein translocase subunit YajC [Gaiellaceae bacterium]
MSPILFLGLMVVLVWFLLIMPQRRRQRAQRQAREAVNPGDTILTAGGIYATVREVREHDLTVEIAPGLEVRLDRRAIATNVPVVEKTDDDDTPAEEPLELEPVASHETDSNERAALDEEPTRAARS